MIIDTQGFYKRKIDLIAAGVMNTAAIDVNNKVSDLPPYCFLIVSFDGTCELTGAFLSSTTNPILPNSNFMDLSPIIKDGTYFSANINLTIGAGAGLDQEKSYPLIYEANTGLIRFSNGVGINTIPVDTVLLINGTLVPIDYKDQVMTTPGLGNT